MTSVRALVFMSGRDCAAYLRAAIASVAAQTHPDVHLLYVDDASQDGSADLARAALAELLPGRHSFRQNPEPLGKAASAGTHLRELAPDATFVAVVDADDALASDDVLAVLAERYRTGFDVVWTNYVTDDGRPGRCHALNAFTSPRGQGWASSHLFSFRAELWAGVPDAYLQDQDGVWVRQACDVAMALPLLDQTRRYLYLPIVGYRYTASNPASHHNQDATPATPLSSRAQLDRATELTARPPLPCHRFPGDVPEVLHEVIAERLGAHESAIVSTQAALRPALTRLDRMPYTVEARRRLVEVEGVPPEWLDAVGGWSLDVELLDRIAETLSGYAAPHVLEMGSGAGTRVLARLVANRGGRLATVEHDETWHARTSGDLAAAGLRDTALVHLCPLIPMETFGVQGRFYDLQRLRDPAPFDVVIVDGPPTVTNRLARLPALPAVVRRLSPAGFHVFLDDYERPDEKEIVAMWRDAAPDLVYDTWTFAKEVAVIRSRATVSGAARPAAPAQVPVGASAAPSAPRVGAGV
ncbi:MAG TPA: glycosyltransferase [Cellulomonas sp.]